MQSLGNKKYCIWDCCKKCFKRNHKRKDKKLINRSERNYYKKELKYQLKEGE